MLKKLFKHFNNHNSKNNKNVTKEDNQKIDYDLLRKIQPQGGISFNHNKKYIITGDGYEACLRIWSYPKTLDPFWLSHLTNLPNTIVSIDLGVKDKQTAIKNIDISSSEQYVRYYEASNLSEKRTAQRKYRSLDEVQQAIEVSNEVIRLMDTRIFVYSKTIRGLERAIEETISELQVHGYKASVMLSESENDWASQYTSYTKQHLSFIDRRTGYPVVGKTLGYGNPFHYTSLLDPAGTLYGFTSKSSGEGPVIFDYFHKDSKRLSYNGVMGGKMRSGKSTTMKKITGDLLVKGDKVRQFDATGEYMELCSQYGGVYVNLDGTGYILNIMEIQQTTEEFSTSFVQHIAKLGSDFKFYDPTVDAYTIAHFEEEMKDLYTSWGFFDDKGIPTKVADFKTLQSTDYPILKDAVDYIKNSLYIEYIDKDNKKLNPNIPQSDIARKEKCFKFLDNLCSTYGHIFNGHTTLRDLSDEQYVVYGIKDLMKYSQAVQNIQIFNTLSLSWDHAMKNGIPMKQLFDAGKITPDQATHFLIMIDESHRIINPNKPHAVQQLTLFAREAPKYFAGLLFASQTYSEYLGTNDGSKDYSNALADIKTLFELTQYKFIMLQDPAGLAAIDQLFENELTNSERNRITNLNQGECILSITGDRVLDFKVKVSKEELSLFGGGA